MGVKTLIRFASTDKGSTTIIGVAGRLEADHLAEIERHYVKARHSVVFDLAQLQSVDEASIRWLSPTRFRAAIPEGLTRGRVA